MFRYDGILTALEALGSLLEEQGESFDAIVLGGASLLASGIIDRPTVDVDVVAQRSADGQALRAVPLPEAVESAAAVVARLLQLPADWFNSIAGTEFELGLPDGCMARLRRQGFGTLTVWWVHRTDLVAFKLVAAADHVGYPTNKHRDDLVVLQPTAVEFEHGIAWFEQVTAPSSAAFSALDVILGELGHER